MTFDILSDLWTQPPTIQTIIGFFFGVAITLVGWLIHWLFKSLWNTTKGIRSFWELVHGDPGGSWFELLPTTGYDLWVCLRCSRLINQQRYRSLAAEFGQELIVEVAQGFNPDRLAFEIVDGKLQDLGTDVRDRRAHEIVESRLQDLGTDLWYWFSVQECVRHNFAHTLIDMSDVKEFVDKSVLLRKLMLKRAQLLAISCGLDACVHPLRYYCPTPRAHAA